MRRARSCLKRFRTSSSENGPPKYFVTSRSPQSCCASGKSSAVHQRNPSRSLFKKYFSVVSFFALISVIISSLLYYSTETTRRKIHVGAQHAAPHVRTIAAPCVPQSKPRRSRDGIATNFHFPFSNFNRRAAPASDRSATPAAPANIPPGKPPPSESAPCTQT